MLIKLTYQSKTGCLTQGAHPGSYNGQDAYSDMLVTESKNVAFLERDGENNSLNGQKCRGGQRMPDKEQFNAVVEEEEYVARRLTPTECARLQGFPDDWCSDVPHKDSAEYKLWGNGIALPCLLPMMKAMKDILESEGAI